MDPDTEGPAHFSGKGHPSSPLLCSLMLGMSLHVGNGDARNSRPRPKPMAGWHHDVRAVALPRRSRMSWARATDSHQTCPVGRRWARWAIAPMRKPPSVGARQAPSEQRRTALAAARLYAPSATVRGLDVDHRRTLKNRPARATQARRRGRPAAQHLAVRPVTQRHAARIDLRDVADGAAVSGPWRR